MNTIFSVALMASTATAPIYCDSADAITARLAAKYGEQLLITMALGGPASVRLYINIETGTWSLVTVDPKGKGCMPASGTGVQFHAPEPAGEAM